MDEAGDSDYQFSRVVTLVYRSSITVKIKFLYHVFKVFLDRFLSSASTFMEHKLGQSNQRSVVTEYPPLEVMEIILHVLLLLSLGRQPFVLALDCGLVAMHIAISGNLLLQRLVKRLKYVSALFYPVHDGGMGKVQSHGF